MFVYFNFGLHNSKLDTNVKTYCVDSIIQTRLFAHHCEINSLGNLN